MKSKKTILSLLLALSLFVGGCSKIPTNANAAFRNFTLGLFRDDVSSNALGLHYTLKDPAAYGITDIPITLGTFTTSPAASLVFFENCRAALDKFPYDSLSKENKLTYDILSYYIDIEKTGAQYCLYAEPLSPITGIHAQLPILLSEYSLSTESDIVTYLELLQTTPDYFSSLILFEQAKAEQGLFMNDEIVSDVLDQCNVFLQMGEQNYLLSSFIDRISSIPELTPEKRTEYISKNKENINQYVLPAYQSLVAALETLSGSGTNDKGLCYYPNGREYYTYLVASETGSSLSLSDIKVLMETQIAEDLLQMVSISDPLSFNSAASSPIQILQNLKDKIKNAFPDSIPVTVNIKYVPEALEPHLSPAFYFIPAIDDIEDNVIYINQSYSLEDIQLFSTLAHEGYPGHLYQTTYFASQNPDPIRHLFSFKGYVEGWATYAEMCSYYISSLDKSSAKFAQKNNSLLLGLYAMADLGIHYEGWTLEDTQTFFSTYGIDDSSTIKEIYNYIIGDPANYLAYYVGYLEILELRKNTDLSAKEFHQKFLDIGPAPFSVVQKYLRD